MQYVAPNVETNHVTSLQRQDTLSDDDNRFQKNIWIPEMAAIYLIEQGTSIYKDYQRFIIHVSEKQKLEVPIREVEQIRIRGLFWRL